VGFGLGLWLGPGGFFRWWCSVGVGGGWFNVCLVVGRGVGGVVFFGPGLWVVVCTYLWSGMSGGG